MTAPAAATLGARAREIASGSAPVRDRLRELIALAAEARRIAEPAERRKAELGVFEASRPLLQAEERPVRLGSAEHPLDGDALAREVAAANARRARREALAPSVAELPIAGPRWAERVLDLGDELVALHAETLAAYPIDPFRDLDAEELAAVVARRLLGRGFDRGRIGLVLEALGVPPVGRTAGHRGRWGWSGCRVSQELTSRSIPRSFGRGRPDRSRRSSRCLWSGSGSRSCPRAWW